jgi:hypothetical protein
MERASSNPSLPGDLMTAKEAMEYLRLPSVKALYQRVARGQINRVPFGRRAIRFRRRDLDAALRPAEPVRQAARVESTPVCAVAGR